MSSAPPSWIQDAIFYQIFPDRFAKSDRVAKPSGLEPWDSAPTGSGYKGGDLLGVVDRLDWLADLGVTALYFTPVFQSASNHRYHTHDYYRVDPMLGGNAALRTLLDEAHGRGMKVVLDGVFNHASRGFFQFSDILENGPKSAYLDWFHIRQFPLNAYEEGPLGYEAWWNLPALPKFNTANPAVREYLMGAAEYWLRFGIDGWRLDVPNEIDDDEFWREFRKRCRDTNPDCYLVGEIWVEADRWLRGDQFDAVMNYPLTRAILGFAAAAIDTTEASRSGYRELPIIDAPDFMNAARTLFSRYREETVFAQLNLLGSHDTPRVRTLLCEDDQALRMAYLLLLTLPGTPCIYYGDEIGLRGGHDPYCRATIPWDSPLEWDHQLRDYLRRLIALRRERPALRHGRFEPLHAEGPLLAYGRRTEGESLLVVANRGGKQVPVTFRADDSWDGCYLDPLGGLRLEIRGGVARGFDAPARRAAIFLPSPSSGAAS